MPRTFALGLASALLLGACWPGNIKRQQLPDGSWQISCRLPLDDCARQADKLCLDQRYRVLRGVSGHVYRGVAPTQVDYRVSELTITCGDDAPAPATAVAAAPSAAGASAPKKSVCVPGTTQACVGPGACAGGQACRDDGSGFSACDCGATTTGAPAPSAPVSPSPAPGSAPGAGDVRTSP